MSYEANEHSKECYYEMRNAVIAMQPVASCSDAISRQGLLDTIDRFCDLGKRQLKEIVRDLPPVTPKQRTGHWILRDDINGQYQCDECGMFSGLSKFDVEEAGWKLSNFCSNCGAKMVEPQESETNYDR